MSGTVGSGDLTIWQDHYPAALVAASTASEDSVNELAQSLPNNFFVMIYPEAELDNSLDNVPTEEMDDSIPRAIVFELLDLQTTRTTQVKELYFLSRQEDSEQSEAIDEVFKSFETSLFGEFV